MSAALLAEIRDLVQQDVGGRGLARDPHDNLLTACPDDFAAACRSIAETPEPVLGVVTGFYIASADPPCAETDGPLGALFLARALKPLGSDVMLATDPCCRPALKAGLKACGLARSVWLKTLPQREDFAHHDGYCDFWPSGEFHPYRTDRHPTHYIAVERVGPGHTLDSLRAQPGSTPEVVRRFQEEVPAERRGRCHSMRGRDITAFTRPAHVLFEEETRVRWGIPSIGIGDGGNEIGMGKVPWGVIRHNIPDGGLIACRVLTDYLIVAGVSNWGAYALAAGVAVLRGRRLDPALFDVDAERDLLRVMVEQGPLVDGVTAKPTVSVDGLSFEEYAEPLRRLGQLLGG
jgi:hypothetical protein